VSGVEEAPDEGQAEQTGGQPDDAIDPLRVAVSSLVHVQVSACRFEPARYRE
jgi:hypothetical protein